MSLSPTASAKLVAAGHSLWITAISLGGGMYLDAVNNGATTPEQIGAYVRAHWVAWAAANVIAPAIRAAREPSVPSPEPTTPVAEQIPLNGVAIPPNPPQPAQPEKAA